MRHPSGVQGLAVVSVLLTGCSLLFTRGPDGPAAPGDCTEGRAAPIVDTVLAGGTLLLTAAAVGGAVQCVTKEPTGPEKPADPSLCAAVFLPLGVLEGISAAYGFYTTSRCRRAKAAASGVRDADRERDRSEVERSGSTAPTGGILPGPAVARATAPPRAAAGFEFGATVEQAAETCTRAGGQWQAVPPQATCSKAPASVGFEGPARVSFTDGKVSSVEVAYEVPDAEANALKDRYVAAAVELRQKYGKPDRVTLAIPPTCSDQLASCLRAREASASAVWVWPNQFTILLSLAATDHGAMLALEHRAPGSAEPAAPDAGLPQDGGAD